MIMNRLSGGGELSDFYLPCQRQNARKIAVFDELTPVIDKLSDYTGRKRKPQPPDKLANPHPSRPIRCAATTINVLSGLILPPAERSQAGSPNRLLRSSR